MCGIIGAASSRSVGKILVNGLKKMEYRGYDSAGLVLNSESEAIQLKTLGKVAKLEDLMIEKSDIPFINENSGMKKALGIITKKKLGLLIAISKNKQTTGIITDGQIRRSIQKETNIKD